MRKFNGKKAGIICGVALASFTSYALLDTFVIPHPMQTVSGQNLDSNGLSINEEESTEVENAYGDNEGFGGNGGFYNGQGFGGPGNGGPGGHGPGVRDGEDRVDPVAEREIPLLPVIPARNPGKQIPAAPAPTKQAPERNLLRNPLRSLLRIPPAAPVAQQAPTQVQ